MSSFGIIVLFEVSKLSFTGLIKMILKGKKKFSTAIKKGKVSTGLKKENFSAAKKRFNLPIKSEPTRRFNWKNNLKA